MNAKKRITDRALAAVEIHVHQAARDVAHALDRKVAHASLLVYLDGGSDFLEARMRREGDELVLLPTVHYGIIETGS